jgi:hypothetical protein
MDVTQAILDELARLKMRVSRLETLEATYAGSAGNADTVDLIHAATTATANKLLALDADKDLHLDTGDLSGAKLDVTGQITSTLATGTAPLAVTSTTVNPNLNADQVDGKNANQLQVLLASGTSTTNFAPAGASGAWETDTTLTVNITPAVQSTLVVFAFCQLDDDTVRANAIKLGLILDDVTTGGRTENLGAPVASSAFSGICTHAFTGVNAAAHTVKLQVCRVVDTDAVLCKERFIQVICVPE